MSILVLDSPRYGTVVALTQHMAIQALEEWRRGYDLLWVSITSANLRLGSRSIFEGSGIYVLGPHVLRKAISGADD